MARRFGFDNPYTVIHGRQENREDVVRYQASIPYQAWMDHASMILLQEGKECCEVDLLDITVIEPDVAVETPALPTEFEVCDPCKEMVSFLTPKEEPLKVRSEQSTLFIEFPVGKTVFDADYKNNRSELQKLKEILDPLEDGDLVTFKSINVCGYSSPDGSVRTNDRVAKQRAESFALIMDVVSFSSIFIICTYTYLLLSCKDRHFRRNLSYLTLIYYISSLQTILFRLKNE
jgi:outer membrane protein OmpA-like peptidoglycan-associated protein